MTTTTMEEKLRKEYEESDLVKKHEKIMDSGCFDKADLMDHADWWLNKLSLALQQEREEIKKNAVAVMEEMGTNIQESAMIALVIRKALLKPTE